jgi:hypothetical protein
VEEEVSLYDVANDIAATSKGMMMAMPESEWDVFYTMSTADMASTLLDLAHHVHLEAMRKRPRGPKKPRPTGDGTTKKGHVSTAK